MQYNINTNVPKAKEWGLNANEALVFGFLFNLPTWAKRTTIENKDYYFANRSKAIEETGGIVTDKDDTMYRHYKNLEKKGVIQYLKIGKKDHIHITEKGKKWLFVNSEINPSIGNKSENDADNSEINPKNTRKNSEKFPTDNNTNIKDNNTNLYNKEEEESDSRGIFDKEAMEDYLREEENPSIILIDNKKIIADEFSDKIKNDQMFIENTCMVYKMNQAELVECLDQFVKVQLAIGDIENEKLKDFRQHFFYWIPKRPQKRQTNGVNKKRANGSTTYKPEIINDDKYAEYRTATT